MTPYKDTDKFHKAVNHIKQQRDKELWQILSFASIISIGAVTIGCIANKKPAVTTIYYEETSSVKQPPREIPPDLIICRDTNGPIDWRTNK
jgi:hypothetical protein